MQTPETKICTICKIEQSLTDFARDRQILSGRKGCCKKCNNDRSKEWHRNNKERRLFLHKRHKRTRAKTQQIRRTTPEGRAKSLWFAAAQRARLSGIEFNITSDLIYTFLVVQNHKCIKTGISFDYGTDGKGKAFRKLNGPSLDRKDNTKGYTADNIQLVCWFYNAAKGTSSDEELENLLLEMFQNRFRVN